MNNKRKLEQWRRWMEQFHREAEAGFGGLTVVYLIAAARGF